MEEFLVIVACLYQRGCTEASSTYYDSKPELQVYVKTTERQLRAKAGPIFWDYGAPVLLLSAGAQGSIKVSSNVQLKFSKQSTDLIFKKDF